MNISRPEADIMQQSSSLIIMVMYTLLDSFWEWVEKQNPLGGSKFSKSVNYALNQKPYMKNYLKDGRCSISNNAAEQAVKSYVMERKNFLFHDTVKGATARITAKSFLSATLDSTSRKQISWISTILPDAG